MKMFERLQAKKKDNKGFSLVELIIVIAIMAILVGVVGTQVVPYLNKSKVAKDQQLLSAFATAAVSAYSMKAGDINYSGKIEIPDYFTAIADSTTNSAQHSAYLIQQEMQSLVGYKITEKTKLQDQMSSAGGKNISSLKIVLDQSGHSVTVSLTSGDANALKVPDATATL